VEPRYNIAPSDRVGIIRQDREKPQRHFSLARWGLIPYWAKDPGIGYRLINARSETVTEKPSFREPFERRRCLIPADGFYEWKRAENAKQPFHFGLQDDSLFAFAGLWDRWKDASGQVVESCSILTTSPNALLADAGKCGCGHEFQHQSSCITRLDESPPTAVRILHAFVPLKNR
jgi:putative SOS response-associated peptidase YedK